jgi:hypothetical protein
MGMGLTWGLAWFGVGMILLVVGLVVGVTADVPFPLLFGLLGFLAGITFSGVLGLLEGNRSLEEMSLLRFAGWGGVGGFLLASGFVSVLALAGDASLLDDLVFLGPLFAAAGAGSAAGSLALARKAKDGSSLSAWDDVGELDQASNERRGLPPLPSP